MALLTLKFVTDVRDLDYEVVEFHGELDQSTLQTAEKQIVDLMVNFERSTLVFDMADLAFINSEGIGFVVNIHAKLAKKQQKLVLCGLKGNVADVFDVVGMSKLIPVYKTISEAIEQIKKSVFQHVPKSQK